MTKLFTSSGDLDQTPRFAASDLGLHYLPITLLGSPDYNRLISEGLLGGVFGDNSGIFFYYYFSIETYVVAT